MQQIYNKTSIHIIALAEKETEETEKHLSKRNLDADGDIWIQRAATSGKAKPCTVERSR